MPRWSRRRAWTRTMSPIVITGNPRPCGWPVAGSTEDGPVVPLQPPRTFEQITKYRSVSNALPGPIMESHHPGRPSPAWDPAAWASPERAWRIRIALDLCAFRVPYVS